MTGLRCKNNLFRTPTTTKPQNATTKNICIHLGNPFDSSLPPFTQFVDTDHEFSWTVKKNKYFLYIILRPGSAVSGVDTELIILLNPILVAVTVALKMRVKKVRTELMPL